MSKHHDTPAWLRAIQRDGGPVREALGFRIVANPSVPEGRIEWHHEQGDSAPFQGRAVPLREVGSARAPRAADDPAEPAEAACPDPVVAKTCALLLSRSAVGVKKYRTTLHDNPLSMREWLVHLRDELLDGALYAQRAIDELDGKP